MDFAGRTTAALFLAWFAAQFAIVPPAAAARSGISGCSGAKMYLKRCTPAYRRNGSTLRQIEAFGPRKSRARLHRGGRKLYGGNEAAIRQLSPRLRARGISRLRFDNTARKGCGRRGPWKDCGDERNLADALIQPPNASTAQILKETGIPLIPDVPPIVILRSTGERWPGEFSGVAP